MRYKQNIIYFVFTFMCLGGLEATDDSDKHAYSIEQLPQTIADLVIQDLLRQDLRQDLMEYLVHSNTGARVPCGDISETQLDRSMSSIQEEQSASGSSSSSGRTSSPLSSVVRQDYIARVSRQLESRLSKETWEDILNLCTGRTIPSRFTRHFHPENFIEPSSRWDKPSKSEIGAQSIRNGLVNPRNLKYFVEPPYYWQALQDQLNTTGLETVCRSLVDSVEKDYPGYFQDVPADLAATRLVILLKVLHKGYSTGALKTEAQKLNFPFKGYFDLKMLTEGSLSLSELLHSQLSRLNDIHPCIIDILKLIIESQKDAIIKSFQHSHEAWTLDFLNNPCTKINNLRLSYRRINNSILHTWHFNFRKGEGEPFWSNTPQQISLIYQPDLASFLLFLKVLTPYYQVEELTLQLPISDLPLMSSSFFSSFLNLTKITPQPHLEQLEQIELDDLKPETPETQPAITQDLAGQETSPRTKEAECERPPVQVNDRRPLQEYLHRVREIDEPLEYLHRVKDAD